MGKKMKKLAILFIMLWLVGCGGGGSGDTDQNNPETSLQEQGENTPPNQSTDIVENSTEIDQATQEEFMPPKMPDVFK